MLDMNSYKKLLDCYLKNTDSVERDHRRMRPPQNETTAERDHRRTRCVPTLILTNISWLTLAVVGVNTIHANCVVTVTANTDAVIDIHLALYTSISWQTLALVHAKQIDAHSAVLARIGQTFVKPLKEHENNINDTPVTFSE